MNRHRRSRGRFGATSVPGRNGNLAALAWTGISAFRVECGRIVEDLVGYRCPGRMQHLGRWDTNAMSA